MSAFNMEKEAWLAWQADRSLWPEDEERDDRAAEARAQTSRRRHGQVGREEETGEDDQP